MAHLEIDVDEDTLEQATSRAAQEGTTVHAVVVHFLSGYSAKSRAARSMNELVEMARGAKSGSGGSRWTREELHERY